MSDADWGKQKAWFRFDQDVSNIDMSFILHFPKLAYSNTFEIKQKCHCSQKVTPSGNVFKMNTCTLRVHGFGHFMIVPVA